MKHLAAYLLLNLAGKTPNESSIKSLLDTVGIETDSARLKQLLGELDGKDIDELVNSGLSKLSSVPTGGGAAASGGAAAGTDATAEAAPAEDAKKEEEKEESDEDMGFGLFD
ncbi:ribosomal protein 60S [Rhizophagus irregularis]|uniref:Ribosomal protein 60S n=3 Tax=Rhizophagus irregularis TaxID=588596 RepID=A0A2I1ECX6_9GLOM|nr:60s acidic ribosomal protein P2 [Rhizophagus irregularis DAOM 181602=DAOM 197198]PKC12492.1 ribosomal protein 60S [Rhizophagus irregularis]RGB36500.1 60s acidic ribosomal protein [Rhizophagus diaphanus] [Rhizophagus sp. MUCL 43196]PKC68398.1 ribosomal protein 60S [Rhizophagus irregularis]PKK76536.1 ribosomal protein 60S [Rhizophagus irregularis]PKY19961.1 ribosomal protein 60S [Rhizophagus irregularis]|eukprot:XP_025181169.1 60s acidic ribosomal protein P2 [Rhizophagus irregularis DAOM 181602=DAOM 197198]